MIDHPAPLVATPQEVPTSTKPVALTVPAMPVPQAGEAEQSSKVDAPTFAQAHRWALLVAFAIAAGVILASVLWLRGSSIPVAVARRADLVETVVASGHVESRFRVDISSQITGTVAQVVVQEGETVRKGQPLIVLASDELKNTQTQARYIMAQAQAHVRQMRELSLPIALEARKSAAASLLGTQQIYDRAAILMRQGFITHAAMDDAKKNLDMARTQVRTANAQVATAQSGGSDYATAQSQLDQARAALATASSRLAYTTIMAPRDGELIARSVERGGVVTPGQTLMVLAPAASVQVVLQIDERNLGKIAVGQPALVSADAYPQKRFRATIVFINPGIDIARASATVKLAIVKPPAYLRQDMTVSVDIETARRQAAIVLPGNAVHDALSTQPWVLLVRDGRAVRQPVTLGLQGNLQVQILRGVAVGDVAVPTTSAIKAGDRVRAQAS